jgi:pyruvate formate lyase activating enzyme
MQTMRSEGKSSSVGRDVTVAEVMRDIVQDRPYYARSGGGVTLSGGETFCQADFALALLKTCRAQGIRTAVETAGNVPFSAIEPALPYLNHVLMDIKHINSDKHREFTGSPNELILENARKIALLHNDLTIRVPVVPTFNDTPGEIGAIAKFAASLPGVKRLHLLPYHRLGEDKYNRLGREYAMHGIDLPTNEKMKELLAVAEQFGLTCQIGG